LRSWSVIHMTAKLLAYIEVYKNIVEHYLMNQATAFAEPESEVSTFEICLGALKPSVDRGRPEAAGRRPK